MRVSNNMNNDCSMGISLISEERERQISVESFNEEHDAENDNQELVVAAACYAVSDVDSVRIVSTEKPNEDPWPWHPIWDKRNKHTRLKKLVIAGALIAAEIDRLLRNGAEEISNENL